MTSRRVRIVTSILVVLTLCILFATWWANGKDDSWLYASSAVMVLSCFIPVLKTKKEGK